MLAEQRVALHVVVEEVPDLGDTTVRVGIGTDERPAEPDFTATVSDDALEEMRENGQNAQQAFMAGKIKLAGNYAPALSLAMQLAQPARRAHRAHAAPRGGDRDEAHQDRREDHLHLMLNAWSARRSRAVTYPSQREAVV